jgi:hypothetical protein
MKKYPKWIKWIQLRKERIERGTNFGHSEMKISSKFERNHN